MFPRSGSEAASTSQSASQRPAGPEQRPTVHRAHTGSEQAKNLPPFPTSKPPGSWPDPPLSGSNVVDTVNHPHGPPDSRPSGMRGPYEGMPSSSNEECYSEHPTALPPYSEQQQQRDLDPNDHVSSESDGRRRPRGEKQNSQLAINGQQVKSTLKTFFRGGEARHDEDFDRLYRRKEMYKHEARRYKDDYEAAAAQAEHMRRMVEDLTNQLDKERERVELTKRSANQMQTTMDNKELFLADQAHDDSVRSSYGRIMEDIKTWSFNFMYGDTHAFIDEGFEQYQRVAPLCSNITQLIDLIATKKHKRRFLRGWAAYVISQRLFRVLDGALGDYGVDIWLDGKLPEGFQLLENSLWYTDRKTISHRTFNDWRAFTAELLSKASQSQQDKPDGRMREVVSSAVKEVMDIARPWHKTGAHADLVTAEAELFGYFEGAVLFAKFLRRQRALWSIKFPSRPRLPQTGEAGPLMMDPATMADEKGDDEGVSLDVLSRNYVHVVITPALYKRGTMNGDRFEQEGVAVKASVVMANH